ncbi:ABC transporter permease [Prauserella oleivorans]|uniref:Transport permease protein n=1 Tax=Prauserella oleivorans TaxID=1478153 RepID=A0ABW5WFJ8_9PSEU
MTTIHTADVGGRSELAAALAEARALSGRCLRHVARSPEQLMLMLFLPVMLLLLFRYLFGGAIQTGGTAYVNYVLPGIITVAITFNATVTSVAVCQDMLEGIVARFRSMPMRSATVLLGHVSAALVRHLVSIAVVVGAGFLVGFRPVGGFAEWLGALGVLVLFATAVSWIAVLLGIAAKTVEGASGLSMPLVFIPYVGSALVPPSTMPDVLRVFAENQPVSLVADAVRAWFLGVPVGNAGWLSLLWWAGVLIVVVPASAWLFRRKAAG